MKEFSGMILETYLEPSRTSLIDSFGKVRLWNCINTKETPVLKKSFVWI